MPFALSPGVTVIEKDFSSIIPSVSTSAGAVAGTFKWGPVSEPTTITSEDVLVQTFGGPNDSNYKSFFTAANFLAYTNNLIVNRVDTTGLKNATSLVSGSVTAVTVNSTAGNSGYKPGHVTTITFSAPQLEGGVTTTGVPVFEGSALATGNFTVTNTGANYTTAPVVTISAPDLEGGVRATASATLSGGTVTGITIIEPGSGYFAQATVTITPAAGDITGGSAVATIQVPSSALLGVRITNAGSGYTSAPSVTIANSNTGSLGTPVAPVLTSVYASAAGVKIRNSTHYISDFRNYQQSVYGMFAGRYPGSSANGIRVLVIDNAVWTYAVANPSATWSSTITKNFSGAPGTSSQAAAKNISNDQVHILVLDDVTGKWTGTPSTVLEKYSYLSKIKGVTRSDGTNVYFRDAIAANSKYIYVISTPSSAQIFDLQNLDWTQDIATIATGANLRDLVSVPTAITLNGGVDDYTATDGNLQTAYRQFADADQYDISLIAAGDVSATVVNTIIAEVAEVRKDCVVFFSPRNGDGSPIVGSTSTAVTAVKDFANNVSYRSTYAVMDSGAKYQYDRYNDQYRWIPLNGDVAGLCARTDYTNDPWFSPGGFNRGQIKNVVKLAFNPAQVDRDALYSYGINPVVTFPGQGTVLFGDKTFTTNPTAFDRINVRRLFIVLEKAVATAAKFQLFEFNDDFTRAQFRNLVEPFLRNVQGRRGIVDFRVRCDTTNNTGDVIDANEFVASIFIKPNRSINFITLNFVAARSSVSFDEIGG
jgi:phage tail sheath protein FI